MEESKPQAVLLVLSEPGKDVDLNEFNEWYDEEHVPLRMSSFPEFLTGARYQAIDGEQPTFAALYEVTSLQVFEESKYERLRTNRSARETDIFSRIGLIDRRTYRCVHLEINHKSDTFRHTSSSHHHFHFLLTVELNVQFNHPLLSLEELVNEFQSFQGWRKTLVAQKVHSSTIGQASKLDSQNNSSKPFNDLLIFEFEDQGYEKSERLEKLLNLMMNYSASSDKDNHKVVLVRRWKLYRGWQNSC